MISPATKFSIQVPSIFSFEECAWFLDRNFDDCMHLVHNNEIIKPVSIGGNAFLLKIGFNGLALDVEILTGEITEDSLAGIRSFIVEWFDMDRDILPFYELLQKVPQLSYMATAYKGLRLIGIPDMFEALCWSIIGQQINLSFAYKLKRRLVEAYGTKIEYRDKTHYLFPAFWALANANMDELRAMQFSARKAEYLIGVGKIFDSGSLSKEMIAGMESFEEMHKALINIRGIGTWTANYVLMKSLRMPNGIPHGDTGLLTALQNHKIIENRSETEKIADLFKNFAGWESYLVFYLWRSLSKKD